MKTWFEKRSDSRVEFANYACGLLIEKHNGDFDKAVGDVEELYGHFRENVRNVYQFIQCNIPLFSLYEYNKDREAYEWFLEDQ